MQLMPSANESVTEFVNLTAKNIQEQVATTGDSTVL